MITKNFKGLLALILQSNSSFSNGLIEVKDANGDIKYLAPAFNAFPTSASYSVVFNANTGIVVGSGNTPATENDYFLEQQIRSGVTAATPTKTNGVDESGNPYLEYTFTLTNTTSSDIVVREIGYAQQFKVSTTVGGNTSNGICLLDRTVLDNPVTIPANGYAAIKYTLKTIMPT